MNWIEIRNGGRLASCWSIWLPGEWCPPWLGPPVCSVEGPASCWIAILSSWCSCFLLVEQKQAKTSMAKGLWKLYFDVFEDFFSRSPRDSQSQVCHWCDPLSFVVLSFPRPSLVTEICSNFTLAVKPVQVKNLLISLISKKPPSILKWADRAWNALSFLHLQALIILVDNQENALFHAFKSSFCLITINKSTHLERKGELQWKKDYSGTSSRPKECFDKLKIQEQTRRTTQPTRNIVLSEPFFLFQFNYYNKL